MSNLLYQIATYVNVISLVIGITLGLLLIFTKRTNRKANRFLGFIPIIIILWQCWVLVTTHDTFRYFQFLDWIPFSSLLAIGPCVYFYVTFTTTNTLKLRAQDLIHFIPLLLEWFFFYAFSPDWPLENYQTYTLISTRFALQFVGIISISIYCYFSIRIIAKHSTQSDVFQNLNLTWLSRSILVFALLWLLWIPYVLVNAFFFNFYISDYDFYPLYLVIWFFTLWMTAKVFLKPEIILIEANKRRYKSKRTPSKKVLTDAVTLNKKMKSNQYFLNPNLTLQSLSSELGLHSNTISQTINEGLNKSFSDFVNEYRIRAVIGKLNSEEFSNLTILGIAYESGFNSKTTFNRAFKKVTGKTPNTYKKELNTI